MSENNFVENRTDEAIPLSKGDVPETTNVVSEQGDVLPNEATQLNEAPQKKKKKPKYYIDPKLIYPGSGVHHRSRKRKTLTKDEYDALFRPDEHKNKPRNDKW